MMRLNKKQAVQLTLALWDWLYENPTKSKEDWPGWKKNGGKYPDVTDDCFCCEYTQFREDENYRRSMTITYDSGCESYCPLNEELKGCRHDDSFWQKWINAKSSRTKKKYAGKIANASAKKLVEFC